MSTYDIPHHIHRSIKAGASGYVIKDDASRDLVPAVRTLHQGKRYFRQKIAELAKLYLEEQAKLRLPKKFSFQIIEEIEEQIKEGVE